MVAQVVAAVEIIKHLENPRAFVRELVRLVCPGGTIVVTTPNQLSLLSKWTLMIKGQFNAFQDGPGLFPAHLSALLEIDLRRIARECGSPRSRSATVAEDGSPERAGIGRLDYVAGCSAITSCWWVDGRCLETGKGWRFRRPAGIRVTFLMEVSL